MCGSRNNAYCCPGWKTLTGGNQCIVRKYHYFPLYRCAFKSGTTLSSSSASPAEVKHIAVFTGTFHTQHIIYHLGCKLSTCYISSNFLLCWGKKKYIQQECKSCNPGLNIRPLLDMRNQLILFPLQYLINDRNKMQYSCEYVTFYCIWLVGESYGAAH